MNVSPVNHNYNTVKVNNLPSDLTPQQVADINNILGQLQTLNYQIEHAGPPEKGILEWEKNQLLGSLNNLGISEEDMPAVMNYINDNQYNPPAA